MFNSGVAINQCNFNDLHVASPGLSGRHEGSTTSHRSRLNNSYSFDDCTEDSLFRGNIYGSSSCESYNEFLTTDFDPPINFYISEDDEKPLHPVKVNQKKLPPAYHPNSGPTYLLPPVLKWTEDTFNNNPSPHFQKQDFLPNLTNMTKDENMPFSTFCKSEDMPTSVDHTTKSPPLGKLLRHQESRKLKPVKIMIRSSHWNLDHPIRRNLWNCTLKMQPCTGNLYAAEDYWKCIQHLFGSTDVESLDTITVERGIAKDNSDKHLFYNYNLNEKGVQACCRIVQAFIDLRPQITECRILYPITALLLHYMEEVDAFLCLDRMFASKNPYFTMTAEGREHVSSGLDILAKKHQKLSYNKMSKLNVPDKHRIFSEWDIWIFQYLPFHLLIRVMDCYFNEGLKVFYRTCITCFTYCIKDALENTSIGSALTSDGFAKSMQLFLPNMEKSSKQFLKHCFKIRKFSSKEVDKAIMDRTHEFQVPNQPLDFNLSDDAEINFTEETENALRKCTRTATIVQFLQIWKHLPMRVQLCKPSLIFTTQEHGSSLNTLYRLSELYAPFLMLIKDDDDHVFGAYCSHSLQHRNEKDEYDMHKTFFGNGETIVFSVNPIFQSYPWVGVRIQSENATHSYVDRACQLFIHADNDQIMIGGGLDSAAIQVDKDLRMGKSSPCPTFNSPILSKNSDYSIKVLEIYSLTDNN